MKNLTIREAQALYNKGYAIILASGEVLRIEREDNANRKRDFSGNSRGCGKGNAKRIFTGDKGGVNDCVSRIFSKFGNFIVGRKRA